MSETQTSDTAVRNVQERKEIKEDKGEAVHHDTIDPIDPTWVLSIMTRNDEDRYETVKEIMPSQWVRMEADQLFQKMMLYCPPEKAADDRHSRFLVYFFPPDGGDYDERHSFSTRGKMISWLTANRHVVLDQVLTVGYELVVKQRAHGVTLDGVRFGLDAPKL